MTWSYQRASCVCARARCTEIFPAERASIRAQWKREYDTPGERAFYRNEEATQTRFVGNKEAPAGTQSRTPRQATSRCMAPAGTAAIEAVRTRDVDKMASDASRESGTMYALTLKDEENGCETRTCFVCREACDGE